VTGQALTAPLSELTKLGGVIVWMNMPSHHQAGLMAALSALTDLTVCYYGSVTAERQALGWDADPVLAPYELSVAGNSFPLDSLPRWRERVHILSGYRNPLLRRVISRLSDEGVNWVHWSEAGRPGPAWWLTLPAKRRYAKTVNRHALCALGTGAEAVRDLARWGIRRELLAELAYSVPPLRTKTGKCDADSLKFVYVGSLCRWKGTDILLKAFAEVYSSNRNGRLALVGDDRSAGTYQRLVRTLGISDAVEFVGPVPSHRVADVMSASDVLVLPSRRDGWGVVLNEAASCGLALIASTAAGGAHHLVQAGVNGFVVKPGSVASLVEALTAYCRRPDLAREHGRCSLRLFEPTRPEIAAPRLMSILKSFL
jgi:glycosyltransferase involved in cell wall biosynthesis